MKYLQDRVQCLECKKVLKLIDNKHLKLHNMTKNEYKIKYPEAQLVSEVTSIKRSNGAKKLWENKTKEEKREFCKVAGENGRKAIDKLRKEDHDFDIKRGRAVSKAKKLNNNSSKEYKEYISKISSQNIKSYWKNLTNKEYEDLKKQRSVESLNWWKNSSDKKIMKRNASLSKAIKNYWDSMDVEKKSAILKKCMKYKRTYGTIGGSDYSFRSKLELEVANHLHYLGYSFEFEPFFILYNNNSFYYPDFYLKDINLIIEVKCDWSYKEKIDEAKKDACINAGYNFVFITYGMVNYKNPEETLEDILTAYSYHNIAGNGKCDGYKKGEDTEAISIQATYK